MSHRQLQASLLLWKTRLAVRESLLRRARQAAHLKQPVTADEAVKIHLREDQVSEARAAVARRVGQLAELARPAHPSRPIATVRSSPNQSSRNGQIPRLIVLHSTEGDYAGAVSWLCDRRARASAHVVVSATGQSTNLVPDDAKAWHVAAANSYALGIEQEGFASQRQWPEAQLKTVAAWVAYWADKYDIPLEHSTARGVCCHSDLGAKGGGHHDPGAAYPLERVLELARGL